MTVIYSTCTNDKSINQNRFIWVFPTYIFLFYCSFWMWPEVPKRLQSHALHVLTLSYFRNYLCSSSTYKPHFEVNFNWFTWFKFESTPLKQNVLQCMNISFQLFKEKFKIHLPNQFDCLTDWHLVPTLAVFLHRAM
jgi:hypothetical protein